MDFEEVADLIVEGKNRQAYEKLRDYLNLNSWEARAFLIAARKAPQAQPFPTEAEIDASHDRAINGFELVRKAKSAAEIARLRAGKTVAL